MIAPKKNKIPFFFFLALFIATTFAAAVVDASPPPLGETPPITDVSTPTIEVLQTYSIPNPEEVAVDPTKSFFVSGTNDGYVYKVDLDTGFVETIFTPRDFRPEFFVESTNNTNLTTDQDIREFCDGSDLAKENVCGRVLGIKYELDDDTSECKSIWMANAYFGIYEGTCEAPWKLEQRVNITGGFVNDIEPNGDDYIYYTITHSSKTRNQLPYVVLDNEQPGGSFHRLDKTNYTTEQLADGVYFANGLASSTDGKSIYISETTAARILKYDIATGDIELFLENIPVLTDNIVVVVTQDGDGQILVPGYTRNADMEVLLKDPVALQAFLAQGPAVVALEFKSMILPHGNLLIYDEATGDLKERIFHKDMQFALASSAHKLNENEYLVGSVFVPAATRFRVIVGAEGVEEGKENEL